MLSSMTRLSIAASFAAVALAGANFGQRTCPDISPVTDLDLESYAGTWYEITRDKATPFELLSRCVVADYGYVEADQSLTVMNSGYRYNSGW